MQPGIATQPHMHIVRGLDTMKKIGLILCAGFCLFLMPGRVGRSSQRPERSLSQGLHDLAAGRETRARQSTSGCAGKIPFRGKSARGIEKTHADWQPAIVDFRSRKIGENILRVQGKLGMQKDLAATSAPPPPSSSAPVLPDKSGPAEPSVEVTAPRSNEARAPPPPAETRSSAATDAAIKEATKKLQDKVDQLQVELQKSRTQYDAVAKEKENLNGRLQETNSKLEKAQADLEKTKGAEKEVRGQLAQAEESLKKISATAGNAKAQEALRAEIAQLKKALESAEKGRAAAEKEKDVAGDDN